MKNICSFIITLLALCSCTNENKSINQNAVSTAPIATIKKVSAHSHKYFITTAEIDSKIQPIKNGTIQESLKKNTLVKLLNEVSQFRDTVTVGKRKYIEPYEKVKVLSTGTETWVFGGALKSIYTGENDLTDPQSLQSFSSMVENQDPTELSSGKKVLDKLKELKSTDITTNDAMFFMAYDYVNRLARSSKAHGELIANYPWTLDDYNEIITGTMDMNQHPIGKILHENGLNLEGSLGDILVKSNIHVVDDVVGNDVSTSVQKYIEMLQLSEKSKIFDNDNISAPLTSVANQANLWSQFAADYPEFAHISNVNMKSNRLTQALLEGTKNTAAFDHASRVAKKEYRDIWNYVLKYYSETPLATEVRSHTKWLEGRDWKFPEEKHIH